MFKNTEGIVGELFYKPGKQSFKSQFIIFPIWCKKSSEKKRHVISSKDHSAYIVHGYGNIKPDERVFGVGVLHAHATDYKQYD